MPFARQNGINSGFTDELIKAAENSKITSSTVKIKKQLLVDQSSNKHLLHRDE